MKAAEENNSINPPRNLRLAAIVAGGLAALGFGGYFWFTRTGAEPPVVSSEGIEPAVWAAIEEARNAVHRQPRSEAAWGRLGMVLLAHKIAHEADVCFAQAEKLDPRELRWPYYRGVIQSLEGAPSLAIPKFQQAAEIGGDRPDALRLKLAEVLTEQGRITEAREQYERLLALDPVHSLAHLGLARLAYDQGELEECQAHLKVSAASSFSRKASHALLAALYERQADQSAAEREAQMVAQLPGDSVWPDPFSEELVPLRVDRRSRFKKATQLMAQRKIKEAIDTLNELIRDAPDFDVAWLKLGHILYQAGEPAKAERALLRSLELKPESVEGQYYMGTVILSQGRFREAEPYFRKATELKPDDALAHHGLGRCLKLAGDNQGAIQEFRTAVSCYPNLAEAHRDLAELLAQNGMKSEALEHLRQAVELDPADLRAKKLLEQWQASRL
jgi:tetratricopeptide (TPR) repeat protein